MLKMNTANKITIFRILLVPIFIICFEKLFPSSIIPLIIFIIGAFSDFLDGFIARKYNQVTTFGKFLDPIADKILAISAFILFLEQGIVPAWTIIVIIFRELLVSALRMIASSNNINIAASYFGKFKTVTQFIAIILIMLNKTPETVNIGVYYLSVALTGISGLDYIYKNKEVLDLKNI